MHIWPFLINLHFDVFAYVRPSGGLLSEIVNIMQGLQHFLKGRNGAILIIGRHHCEIAIFHFFQNVFFCDPSAAKSMILNWTMKNIGNHELSIVQKPL